MAIVVIDKNTLNIEETVTTTVNKDDLVAEKISLTAAIERLHNDLISSQDRMDKINELLSHFENDLNI